MMQHRVGAPRGLRVHWLHYELSADFTLHYHLNFTRKFHNYRYARFRKRTLIDEFIVIRSSKKCYRVMYFNNDFKFFKYFSARNYRTCAEKMENIFKTFKAMEDDK